MTKFYNIFLDYNNGKQEHENDELLLKYKNSFLNEITLEFNELNIKFEQYQNQLYSLHNTKESYLIRSQSDGIIHLYSEVYIGMYLQAGSNIGLVIPQNDVLVCEVYISYSDRPKIQIGNKVTATVIGLSQNDYGTVLGTLIES